MNEYATKIINEAQYWDNINERRNKFGITPEIDFYSPPGLYEVPYILINKRLITTKYPYWKLYYHDYNDRFNCTPLRKLYIDNLPLKPLETKFALEVGCGPGAWSVQIARLGFRVEAFDVSQETIKIANNHLEYLRSINENLSIRYFVHDANKIELEENKYSFILIQSAIHHIENGQHILSETIKSLEKDGILLIIEHNTNKLLPKLISHFLLLILPTIPSYTSKIKYYSYFIYRKIFRIVPDYFLDDGESPFEDITPVNKVIQILNSMKIKYTIETTSIICSDIIPNIPLLKYRSILVRIVGKIDWLLNKIFLKSGQYILIRVKK